MPPKYVKRRRFKRRYPLRRRFKRGTTKTTKVRQLSFPDKVLVRLPYAFNSQLQSVVPWQDTVWNINSLFDPEETYIGHQPRGFDQWATIYNRYRVYAISGSIVLRQRAAHGISANLVFTNSSTPLTSAGIPTELVRSGMPKVTSSNQPPIRINFRKSLPAIAGVSPSVYKSDDRYQALTSANPAEVICMHQFVKSLDGATLLDYEYEIKMVYHTEFFDKNNLPLS